LGIAVVGITVFKVHLDYINQVKFMKCVCQRPQGCGVAWDYAPAPQGTVWPQEIYFFNRAEGREEYNKALNAGYICTDLKPEEIR